MSEYDDVDVVAMAKATGINIFVIYETLGLALDSRSQGVLDERSETSSVEGFCEVINRKFEYLHSLGYRGAAGIKMESIDPESEEAQRMNRIIAEGGGIALNMLLALSLSRRRSESGVPWGTPGQKVVTEIEIELAQTLEELKELFFSIPASVAERGLVIKAIAGRYFRK